MAASVTNKQTNKQTNITLEISSYCGADCVMCPHKQYEYKNQFMPSELFIKAVDECVSIGIKNFLIGGLGDAFLCTDIKEKLAYIKDKIPDSQIVMSTTGHIINMDVIQFIDVLKFSNYGLTKESFEAVHRGAVKFDMAQENIKRILELPDTMRPYTHMSFLVLSQNEHEIEEWKTEWQEKVDEIWIWKPHSWVDFYDHKNNIDYSNTKSCGRVFNSDFIIKVTGDVSVCCFDYCNKLILGNIKSQNLSDIINDSEFLQRLRKVHKNNEFSQCDFICKVCDQIQDRSSALIYSSKNRRVGAYALAEDKESRFSD